MAEGVAGYWPMATTGEEIDWEAVYRRDFPRIYNYLRYRLGDDGLAEELAADCFMQAWRSRQQYREELAAFSTWLFTIARNLATDYLRRQRFEVGLEQIGELTGAAAVEKMVQQREEAALLEVLLAELPEREREIIALKYGADISNREIARMMELSVVNVGVIAYRTLRQLRARWEAVK